MKLIRFLKHNLKKKRRLKNSDKGELAPLIARKKWYNRKDVIIEKLKKENQPGDLRISRGHWHCSEDGAGSDVPVDE